MDYAAEAARGAQEIKEAFPDLEGLLHHPSSPWIVCKIQGHKIMVFNPRPGMWTYTLDDEKCDAEFERPADAMRIALGRLRDNLWRAGDRIQKLLAWR
jgi:hypothetical protein